MQYGPIKIKKLSVGVNWVSNSSGVNEMLEYSRRIIVYCYPKNTFNRFFCLLMLSKFQVINLPFSLIYPIF